MGGPAAGDGIHDGMLSALQPLGHVYIERGVRMHR